MIVEVQLDTEKMEYFIELPEDLMVQLNWVVGDTLEWDVRLNGTVYLSKKDDDE